MSVKIHLILYAIAIGLIIFFFWLSDLRGQKITALKGELATVKQDLKGCRDEIKQISSSDEKAEQQISEIKTIVKTVKSDCNCYDSPIDANIIDRVRGK